MEPVDYCTIVFKRIQEINVRGIGVYIFCMHGQTSFYPGNTVLNSYF